MKANVTLSPDQFQTLIKAMSHTDWTTLIVSALVAGLAAYSGFYFQKRFRLEDQQNAKRKEIFSFNEATAFIGVLLETLVTRFPQLSVPALNNDQKIYDNLQKEINSGRQAIQLWGSFNNIMPLEVPNPDQFISKVPNIGKHINVALAFYRLRENMLQSLQICNERTMLIKQFIDTPKIDPRYVSLRCGEILDRTKKLFACEELILDAAYYITTQMPIIAKELKEDFKKISSENIKASFLARNDQYEDVLKQVNEIVDSFTEPGSDLEFKDRFLHMRHQEIAAAYTEKDLVGIN